MQVNVCNKLLFFKQIIFSRQIFLCSVVSKDDQHWRTRFENHNSFSPLTNLPDYTYMDGRPTPLGFNLKKRLDKQKLVAKKIVELSNELQFAKERHVRIQREKEDSLKQKIAKQLKPKGILLYKNT